MPETLKLLQEVFEKCLRKLDGVYGVLRCP
jgi:hypothetical protein